MNKKFQMDASILKHTGKSVFTDSGAKKVGINFISYDDNTTLYEAYNDAYGIRFENVDNEMSVTFVKGNITVAVMSYQEFIDKMFK